MLININNGNPLYNNTDSERKEIKTSSDRRKGSRDEFERDYGRIIHSSSFRRLQAKTQVIGPGEGDFHRTRLTHTLEVCQIARGIAINLNSTSDKLKEINGKIDVSLVEAAALAHDLGHPPYGHQGERALNKLMQNWNLGFEGNAHTFRLLTRLEGEEKIGLNLTRGTLLATLKYPILFKDAERNAVYDDKKFSPPKASIFEEDAKIYSWLIDVFNNHDKNYFTMKDPVPKQGKHYKTINKTLECSIIELADDIAYATHDLEDAIAFRMITLSDFQEVIKMYDGEDNISSLAKKACSLNRKDMEYKIKLKSFFADLIHLLMTNISVELNKRVDSNRIKFKAVLASNCQKLIKDLNKLVIDKVVKSQRVQTIEWKGGYIVRELFKAMMNDDDLILLPRDKRPDSLISDEKKARIVCDYIAGMTDSYAQSMYARLFEPNSGRLFDI